MLPALRFAEHASNNVYGHQVYIKLSMPRLTLILLFLTINTAGKKCFLNKVQQFYGYEFK